MNNKPDTTLYSEIDIIVILGGLVLMCFAFFWDAENKQIVLGWSNIFGFMIAMIIIFLMSIGFRKIREGKMPTGKLTSRYYCIEYHIFLHNFPKECENCSSIHKTEAGCPDLYDYDIEDFPYSQLPDTAAPSDEPEPAPINPVHEEVLEIEQGKKENGIRKP